MNEQDAFEGNEGEYSGLSTKSDAASLMERINEELRITKEQIARRVSGYRYDYINKEWTQDDKYRMLTGDGVEELMLIIDRCLDPSAIMSNLDKRQVGGVLKILLSEMILFVNHKHDKYGIDMDNRVTLVNEVMTRSFFALQRALEEGERRLLKTTYQAKEIFSASQPQQNSGGGFLSRINPFRRR